MADILTRIQKKDEAQKLSERGEGKFGTQVTKPVTIPEHNILQIMNKMEILERKMQDTAAFLGLYNEMKELEAKFLEAVQNAESNTYALSEQVKKRIRMRKDKIIRKR